LPDPVVDSAGKEHLLGMPELWIPSQKLPGWYVSPSLIMHYIEEHEYLPPDDFIDAVCSIDTSAAFHAEEIRNALVVNSYVEYHRRGLDGAGSPCRVL
jgi:hypothetical protein